MTSQINEDPSTAIELPPRAGVAVVEQDLPITIPTPATETAPKGRIIDDSTRGTIFWEAISENAEEKTADEAKSEKSVDEIDDPTDAASQAFGKPFQIEWLSTERLPFFRTRGLRNPWNSNREVKIARDGTELEPGVGRKLVQMFHRPFAGPAAGRPVPPPQGIVPGGFQPRSYQ